PLPPRGLHSLPTRRSSDLAGRGSHRLLRERRCVSPSLLASAPHGLGPRADTSEARRDNLTMPVTIPGARGRNTPSPAHAPQAPLDRKSTRLNSSHLGISYA